MLTATLIHLRSKGDWMREQLRRNGHVQIELDFCPVADELDEWPGRRSRG